MRDSRSGGEARFALTWGRRAMVAAALGCFAAAVVFAGRQGGLYGSDLDETWAAARALLQGDEPYQAISRAYEAGVYPYPLVYPAPAILVAAPFAIFPLSMAQWLWVGAGTGALAWVLLGRGWWGLLGLCSAFYIQALLTVQWSPLLTAAAGLPALGLLWAAKPTIGVALFAGWPSRAAFIGAAALVGLSFVLVPGWVRPFLANSFALPHTTPLILRPGGMLLLLSLVRWRRPEARMLAALAVIPQTSLLYEMVPLLLIPRNSRQMAAIVALSAVAGAFAWQTDPSHKLSEAVQTLWLPSLVLCYLPCLYLVLRRANRAADETVHFTETSGTVLAAHDHLPENPS
jgi:SAM-dependent methyltransferase